MRELESSRALEAELQARISDAPLAALSAITQLRHALQEREREAVFRALETHSWREVGDALGVSKQAAFQRFGREWVRFAQASLPDGALRRTIKDRLSR